MISLTQNIELMSREDARYANQVVLKKIIIETATPRLPMPLLTASGALENAFLVLVTLESECGLVGHSYLFSPNQSLLPSLVHAANAAFKEVEGHFCVPEQLTDHLLAKFRLFGGTGILTMAVASIDMAAWDMLGLAVGKPLYQILGGATQHIHCYESSGLGIGSEASVIGQAEHFVNLGNSRMKVRLGYETVNEEVHLITTLQGTLGNQVELMVDYNQGLSVEQAFARCQVLDDHGLIWIEEPISAELLESASKLTALTKTPIQLGENLWSLTEVQRSLDLNASNYLMPDVAKIGGATQWLRSAKLASKAAIRVSSHLYPEISMHLLASIDNAHYLEYADWTKLQFSGHQAPSYNKVALGDASGIGLYG